jgi:predicted phage terminase large subunit-like protein
MAPHLKLLNDAFLEVAAGACRRLAVFMPPRHGKSSFLSHWAPAWYLGTYPERRVIQCGYGDEFATISGRMVRDTIDEACREGVFSTPVRRDLRAADDWQLQGHRGGLLAAGIGGAITGRGADLLLIDDPIKSRAEADSPAFRRRLWDWYTNDAYTRLEPGGAVVLIQTRWHQDDLAGRLLQAMADESGDWWQIINLPAFAEEDDLLGREMGQPLWPERYPREELLKIKAVLGSYGWASLYQQRPAPREGGFFKAEWFTYVDEAPPPSQWLRVVRYWDLAGTEGGGDWTAGALLVLARDGFLYLVDMRHAQHSPHGVERLVVQTAEQDGPGVPIVIEQDPGQAGKGQVEQYQRLKDLRGYGVWGNRADGPKHVRAEPFAARLEGGVMRVVRAAWNAEFVDELCGYNPEDSNPQDDQIDAVSGAYVILTADADSDDTLYADDVLPGFAAEQLGAARL